MPSSYSVQEYRLLYLRMAAACRNLASDVPEPALKDANSPFCCPFGRK